MQTKALRRVSFFSTKFRTRIKLLPNKANSFQLKNESKDFNLLVHSTLILGFLTYCLFFAGYISGNTILASSTLIYFYYSVFTLWHELAHAKSNSNNEYLINLLGTISIAPLIFYQFEEKKRLHLLHHAHTNDPHRDPDYKANNLVFSIKQDTGRQKKPESKKTRFKFLQFSLFIRLLFCSFLLFWIARFGLVTFTLSVLFAYALIHVIVNIYPHYRLKADSRDLGGSYILTFLLLGNNYHSSHHANPQHHWTFYLKHASKK